MPPTLNQMQEIIRDEIQGIAHSFTTINRYIADFKKRIIAIENSIRENSRMLMTRKMTTAQFLESLNADLMQTKRSFEVLVMDEHTLRSEVEQVKGSIQFYKSEEARRENAPFAVKLVEVENNIAKRTSICLQNIQSLNMLTTGVSKARTITDFSHLVNSLAGVYRIVYDDLNEIDNLTKRLMRDILSFYPKTYKRYGTQQ